MLCSRCNKRPATVFVTRMEDGQSVQEGLCFQCAKELNINPPASDLSQVSGMDFQNMDFSNPENMFKQFGITKESMQELNDQLNENPNLIKDMMDSTMELVNAAPFDFNDDDNEEPNDVPEDENRRKTKTKQKSNKDAKRKLLNQFGVNLTQSAAEGKLDRVIGRNTEIERVTQILNRRTKNNPCIIGEPGVGKTAIAEGLAVKIAEGNVPVKLADKEIYLLDLTSLVAGTQFRGQFESRIKGIIKEAMDCGNIIFVVDEVHNIVSAGDAEGAMGAGNILKPYLAKGQIQIIGATTLEEYRKYIEKDSALERRFQPVMVDEPSIADSIEIIKGIKDYYESFHNIKISDEVVEKAVVMSERYISGRFLPDKAIDIIDEAGARINLNNKDLIELEHLKHQLDAVLEDKEIAVSSDSTDAYQKAAELKVEECRIREQINELSNKCYNLELTVADIAEVIEMWTGIPVKSISEIESKKLISLEDHLHKRLIGQNEAVSAVSRAIRINRAGISGKKRPVSFIFAGPTGVGKTELVKQIAKQLFDSEDALIRLDMSEYMEKHTASKLIGSPPGYVGYDDAGQLTEKVRRKPYSVILLDEIEKAHSDIFNILLQVLDEGRITDSHGRTINFENTIIIMTTNAGSEQRSSILGFNATDNVKLKERVSDALKSLFRPEFLNRIDEVITFDPLSENELKQIAEIMLVELTKGITEKKIEFTYSGDVIEFLVKHGFSEKFGARPMTRAIKRHIEAKIAEQFIKGEISEGDKIQAVVENDEIKINKLN